MYVVRDPKPAELQLAREVCAGWHCLAHTIQRFWTGLKFRGFPIVTIPLRRACAPRAFGEWWRRESRNSSAAID